MKCLSCQAEFSPTLPTCPSCGAAKPRFCTECGASLPPAAKFCSECGQRVQATPELARGAERAQAPAATPPAERIARAESTAADEAAEPLDARVETVEPSIPPELRKKIEAVRAELSGERREVAVVFADLSGFTELSERMDPEDVSFLMNRLLGDLADAVHRYEGYVDKFIGDAVMALFGAPLAHENDAERAVLAAMAMLQVLERHNRAGETPLALRVGINLGEVIAGHVGSGLRLQYTVIGDTVNVASRLEGKAEPNTILVSESLFRRLSSRFKGQQLPPLTVKGKSEPIQTYRILGFEGLERTSAGVTPFVGREAELQDIERFLRRIAERRGGTLLLEGEPGTGKSRLAREAVERSSLDILTIELGFSPVELPGQRSPLGEIFHQLLPDEPPGKSAAERALALLGPEAASHRLGVDGLASEADPTLFLDIPEEMDPAVARQHRWLALNTLLRTRSCERTVLLLVEDIHWTDEATQEFLQLLASGISGASIGILLTSRVRPDSAWLPEGAERLVLQPLDTAATHALLGELLEDLPAEERHDLLRRSEGNPLFLQELARELRQRAQAGVTAGGVPGTLHGLLASRIDRLETSARLLLQMAAVLGMRFPTRLLARIYHLEEQPVTFDQSLRVLEAEDFLEPELNGDVRHRFHHALMQEVAYGGLLLRIRKVLHESAATLGEEYYGGRLEAEAPFFAHHYWEAGLLDRAAPPLWSAGSAAAERFELPAAERFLERAAQTFGANPEIFADPDERAKFHETYGQVLLHRGKLDEAEVRFRALEEMGVSEDRATWIASALWQRGRVAWFAGRLDDALELSERGLAHLPAEEGPLAANLHNMLGLVFYYRGRAEEAFEQHTRARGLREQLGDELGLAKSFSNIGNLLLHFRDDLAGAEASYQKALDLARKVGDRREMSLATNNLGYVEMERGDWERAIRLFDSATQITEEIGWDYLGYVALQNRSLCEVETGRIAEALRHLKRCRERGESYLEPVNRVNTRLYFFEAYLRALADEQAERALRDARELLEELRVAELEDEMRLREGRWLGARGEWREASEAFAAAEDAARGLNHPSVEKLALAHCCRAKARGGLAADRSCPTDVGGRAPLVALISYLVADAEAFLRPSPETARALAEAGETAARLGEAGLERAAFEAVAEIWRKLGQPARRAAALQRAFDAMQRVELGLPQDLRPGFLTHPRNAILLGRDSRSQSSRGS
jgi:class 3 adenylate cyclase/tetratricopeptide (TPR) repeat protein